MDNTPIIPKPVEIVPGMENDGQSIEYRDCYDYCGYWTLQIFLWLLIISEIVLLIILENKTHFLIWIILGTFVAFYILYICLELHSDNISTYLNNISTEQIYQILKKYIKSIPKVYVTVNCTHEEERYSTDSEGKTQTYYETVSSFYTSEEFPYLSARDVSGVFSLNFDDSKIYYLKLDLNFSLEYADDLTTQDISELRKYCYENFKDRDEDIEVSVSSEVPGIKKYKDLKLIKLGENDSYLANGCYFMLFTLLTLAEIYKIKFRSICAYKKFCIKKLVSSRNDITKLELEDEYKDRNPYLYIKNQAYFYEPNEYTYLNHDFKMPKKEEKKNPEQNNNAENYLYSTGNKNNNKGDNNIDTSNVNNNNINSGKSVELSEINNQGYIPPA